MGIMDQFSGFMNRKQQERTQQQPVNPAQQQNQQNQNQQQVPPGSSQQLENNQIQQPQGNQQQNQNTPPEKLDSFKEIWDTTPANGDTGKSKPYSSYDRAKFKDKVKTLDFARTLDPAVVQKALSGDVNSFSQVINQAVQGALAMSVDASHSFTEAGFSSAESRFFERIPGELKKHTAFDSSLSANPKMNHPAIKPMVGLVQNQLQAKFPDASAQEIQTMTSEYFTEVFGALKSDDGSDKTKQQVDANGIPLQKSEDTDWMTLMNLQQ